jgi:hypothetical protein
VREDLAGRVAVFELRDVVGQAGGQGSDGRVVYLTGRGEDRQEQTGTEDGGCPRSGDTGGAGAASTAAVIVGHINQRTRIGDLQKSDV